MRVVVQDTLRNMRTVAYDGNAGFIIGRNKSCQVCLAQSRFVSREHAQVERGEAGWEVRVLDGADPIKVDGTTITPGEQAILGDGSEVRLAEFVLLFSEDAAEPVTDEVGIEDINSIQQDLHAAVLRRLDLRRTGGASLEASASSLEQVGGIIDDLINGEFRSRVGENRKTRERLLEMAFQVRTTSLVGRDPSQRSTGVMAIKTPGFNVALDESTTDSVNRLARRLGMELGEKTQAEDLTVLDRDLPAHLPAAIKETSENVQDYMISQLLKKLLCDTIFGLGPLQDLLDTANVTEIMVVSPSLVYIERGGQVIRSNRTFINDDALLSVIERIVAPLGRRIDRSQPLVDARLQDGSRVNAVIPPLALKGPCITIRRFPTYRITSDDLVKWDSLTDAAVALIDACVKMKKNIVVAGGTGSGKTTLLNVLSGMIPSDERIVTIEDAAELQLQQDHVVTLETRPPNAEGKGAYTIRDLVKNALRMRPDRIIVGECRGQEAFDMLQAMNTGHSGSMTTIHANSSEDVISRLETMFLMAVEIPLLAVRRQVGQAVDLIVHVGRLSNGRRLVGQISEVVGINPVTDEIEVRDIMAKVGGDDDARLVATGYMPSFLGEMVEAGALDLDKWFGEVSS
jgi:pilus assembly protein CpaF